MSLTATESASHGPELRAQGGAWPLEQSLSGLATRQHGVVAAWQLLELGFTRAEILHRARQGRLVSLHAGVYAVGHSSVTRPGRWMAAVLATGREAVISHRDGAALWGVGEFGFGRIEVTLPQLGSRTRPRIRVHRTRRLPSYERKIVAGIPVTSVERLIVDLAATIAPRHIRDAYIAAQRREIVDPELLERVIADSRGRRGVGIARRILLDYTGPFSRTRSTFEVDFLEFSRHHGLPEPRINAWVCGYLVDAYWPDADLVVELDSWEYHRDRKAFESDRARIGDLSLAGIRVIPLTHRQLSTDSSRAADVVRNALTLGRPT